MADSKSIEDAVRRLADSTASFCAVCTMIADAAQLAADQVQDKRLELLEKPPPITADQALIEFFLTFLLESPLAATLAKSLLASIFSRRIGLRELHLACLEADLRDLRGQLDTAVKKRAFIRDSFKKSLPPSGARRASAIQAGVIQATASEVGEVIKRLDKVTTAARRAGTADALLEASESIVGNTTAAAKAARAANLGSDPLRFSTPQSDTAGVAIVKLARDLSTSLQLSAHKESANIAARLRSGELEPEDVASIADGRRSQYPEADLAAMRERIMRYFEAHIWAQLIWARPPNGKPRPGSPEMLFRRLELYAPQELLDYWTRRMIDPNDPEERVFAGRYGTFNPATGRVIPGDVGAVGLYLLSIFKEAEQKRLKRNIQSLLTSA